MKILISNYTFNKTAKTVTFSDYTSITLENVLLITNVTDGITIYQFNEPTLIGTVATNVLTLNYDTTSMSDTDDLQIWYDDPDTSWNVNNVTNNPFNSFQEATVVSSTDTEIFTYTVPASTTLNIEGLLGTGTAVGRFKLKVDGVVKAVARTSAAERDANRNFGQGVILATAAQVVTVEGYHEETANQTLSVNVYGYLS